MEASNSLMKVSDRAYLKDNFILKILAMSASSGDVLLPAEAQAATATAPMSRTQVETFRSSLKVGNRIEITWRYGASLDYEESEEMTWRGTVISENENDDDAARVLVKYDAGQRNLEKEANIPFPPPLLGNRNAEILKTRILRRPGALPDLSIFDRGDLPAEHQASAPANSSREAVGVPREKRARDDDLENIASALKGEGQWVTVADGLRIPSRVNKPFDLLYANEW